MPIPFSKKKKKCYLLGKYFFQNESKFVTEYFILFSENFVTLQKEEVLFPHLLIKALLLFFFIKSSLIWTKSCKSCELIHSFIKQYPVLLIFWLQSNYWWNGDYKVKLGCKDRLTSKITLLYHPKNSFWKRKKEKTNTHGVIKSFNLPPFNIKWERPALTSLP